MHTPVTGVTPVSLVRMQKPAHELLVALGVQGEPAGSPLGGLVFEHRPSTPPCLSQYKPVPHSASERQCGTQNGKTAFCPRSAHTMSVRPLHLVVKSTGLT